MEDYVTKDILDLKIKPIEDENDRQNHRISNLETRIEVLTELTSSVKLLAANMDMMAKEQAKMSARLEDLEAEPAENWKKAVWIVVAALIGAAVGFFLKGVGL